MPELPEVEIVRRSLNKNIKGKKVNKVVVKNNPKTTTILTKSQIIITFFLLNLSASRPANEDMNAGIILATTGTTAVSSEFPSVAPK